MPELISKNNSISTFDSRADDLTADLPMPMGFSGPSNPETEGQEQVGITVSMGIGF